MRIRLPQQPSGIALIIVMICVLVLSALAGSFAYSMKVETKLARNAESETELWAVGRAGIERAKLFVAPGMEPYDALNQFWAGGPGGPNASNSPLAELSLKDVEMGHGKYTVTIVDLERKLNINRADEALLEHVFMAMGVDPGEFPSIIGALLDWVDTDDNTHLNGAESDYYESLQPAYYAKNRPIDDMSELLLVKGVTPELFWGPANTNHFPGALQRRLNQLGTIASPFSYPVGLVDVFTPISSGKVNINTASAMTLQMVPFIDEARANQIVLLRSGFDATDGTDDDMPAGSQWSVRDLLLSAGLSPQEAAAASPFFDQRSQVFQVTVDAQVNDRHRLFIAILARDPRSPVPSILSFYWKEPNLSAAQP